MIFKWPKGMNYRVSGYKFRAPKVKHFCASRDDAWSYVRFLHNSGYESVSITVRTPRQKRVEGHRLAEFGAEAG